MMTSAPEPIHAVAVTEPVPVEDEAVQESAAGDEPAAVPALFPSRTLPLLLLYVATGAVMMIFASLTVHERPMQQLLTLGRREQLEIMYWLNDGFFTVAGMTVRPSGHPPFRYIHRSATADFLFSPFILEKIHSMVRGGFSPRLLALHNQYIGMITAALLGLLGFRLARRSGSRPLHAFLLGLSLQAVHFTFPDNLALYWNMSRREWWILFAAVFLLIEERRAERTSRLFTVAQALAVFGLARMDYLATLGFIVTYTVVSLVLLDGRAVVRRLAVVCFAPWVLAAGLYGGQLLLVKALHPEIPVRGNSFLYRSGLDGGTEYYETHLDIANRRDLAANNFATSRDVLFRWKWLFFGGLGALLVVLIAAMRERIPRAPFVAVVALAGAYVCYAAVFSQAVVVHPYEYDVLLFTPLMLALFVVVPSFIEQLTGRRGVLIMVAFFLALWVSMVQMRQYMLRYPEVDRKPPETFAMRGPLVVYSTPSEVA